MNPAQYALVGVRPEPSDNLLVPGDARTHSRHHYETIGITVRP